MQRIEKLYLAVVVCLLVISNLLSFAIGANFGINLLSTKLTAASEPRINNSISTLAIQSEPVLVEEPESLPEPEPEPVIESYRLTDEEIELVALITLAEAEDQPELGQRLVIDTILNRMDHPKHWPDTVKGVVYMKNAFSVTTNGRLEKCSTYFKGETKEKLIRLVKEELVEKTNDEVVYFRMFRYSDYGTPYKLVGDHYFSTL